MNHCYQELSLSQTNRVHRGFDGIPKGQILNSQRKNAKKTVHKGGFLAFGRMKNYEFLRDLNFLQFLEKLWPNFRFQASFFGIFFFCHLNFSLKHLHSVLRPWMDHFGTTFSF
jgi:hypothetical protein